jgi:ribosomal protein L37AE/L43A
MKKELQDTLLTDFPELYRQFYLPKDQTCMCWGFDTGDGWYEIIYKLSQKLMEIDPYVEATQVKEKFGGLRFYVSDVRIETSDEVYGLINEAESESFETCEKCGSKENVKLREGVWIFTLCNACSRKSVKGNNSN